MQSYFWILKFVIPFFFLASPSVLLLAKVWRDGVRHSRGAEEVSFAFCVDSFFYATYVCWLANILLDWSPIVAVGWPLFGIVISLVGSFCAFFGHADEKGKLLGASSLSFVLAVCSVTFPN